MLLTFQYITGTEGQDYFDSELLNKEVILEKGRKE